MSASNAYLNAPWVKPVTDWLSNEGPEMLTLIGIALGAVTILISVFAPTPVKFLWIVFMLSP